MKAKKALGVLLAGLLAAGALAGCSSGTSNSSAPESGSDSQGSSTAESQAPAEASEVDIWYYWETEKHQETLDRVIGEYNDSQDAVSVSAKYIPFADFKKQLSIGASAAELPDLVIIDSPDHASYAAMGIFADISDKVSDWDGIDQYYEGPLNSCKLDDKLYGLPFGSNCLALFYNEDMLADAGCEAPATWDELKDVAQKTTQGNVTGFAMCCLQNEEGTFNFTPWLWSTGATSYDINNDNGIKALTLVKDLVDAGSMSKEVINWTQGDVMNQFISGNIAMMVNGPWQVPTMREQAPDLNWDVTLLPKDAEYASCLGGENFGVIDGDNVDAALDFLQFATSKDEVASYIDDFGYIAARKDVAEGQFTDDETMQKFTEEMQYAQPRGPHAQWPEISDGLSLAVNESITGTSTPADAAAKAQSTIDGILAE